MSIDTGYHKRLECLAELMLQNPRGKMKKLQKTALKLYPLQSKEAQRYAYSWKFAMKAANLANRMDPKLADYWASVDNAE